MSFNHTTLLRAHLTHLRPSIVSLFSFHCYQRDTYVATDTTELYGFGPPARACGLIKSVFRPSDDASKLPFLVSFVLF